jgi:hypothetical protein
MDADHDDVPEEAKSTAPAEESDALPTPPKSRVTLAARLALPEPQRTEALEKAVHEGEGFLLRSRDGKEIKRRYGRTILKLGDKPKAVSAEHAIHLLFYLGDRVEEVEEE